MSATHVFSLPGYPASVRAVCADGVTRTARPSGNGQADTFFSIPAYVQVTVDGVRRQVAGYVTDDGDGYRFVAYGYRKNGHLIPKTPTVYVLTGASKPVVGTRDQIASFIGGDAATDVLFATGSFTFDNGTTVTIDTYRGEP